MRGEDVDAAEAVGRGADDGDGVADAALIDECAGAAGLLEIGVDGELADGWSAMP